MKDGARPPGQQPQRRLWRRAWRLFLVVAALLLLFRLALPYALPVVANRVLAGQGLAVSWQRLDLSLTDLRLRFLDVELRERTAAAAPLLTVGDLELDVAVRQLLRGRLQIDTVHLAGVRIACDLTADGLRWHGLSRAVPGSAPTAAPEPAPQTSPAVAPVAAAVPAALDFSLPLIVQRLLLHDVQLVVHDEVAGAVRNLRLDASAAQLGQPDVLAPLHLRLVCPGVCDRLDLTAGIRAGERAAAVDLELDLVGLAPHTLPWLLHPLGIGAVARRIDAALRVRGSANADAAGSQADLLLRTSATVAADDAVVAEVGQLEASATLHQDGSLTAGRAALQGAAADLVRRQDGALQLLGIALVGNGSTTPLPAAAATEPPPPLPLAVDSLRVDDVRLHLRDEQQVLLSDRIFELRHASLGPWTTTPGPAEPPVVFELELGVPELLQRLRIESGRLDPYLPFCSLQAHLHYDGLQLAGAAPLLASMGLQALGAQDRGSLGVTADLDAGAARANLRLHDLELHSDDRSVALAEVVLSGLCWQENTQTLSIDRLGIDGPVAAARVTADGLEFLGLRLAAAPAAAPAPEPAVAAVAVAASASGGTAAGSPGPRFVLGELDWRGARCTLRDETGPAPLELAIADFRALGAQLRYGPLAPDGSPGTLSLQFAAPGFAEHVGMQARLAGDEHGAAIDLSLQGGGLSLEPLRAHLAAAGAAPAGSATLALRLHAALQREGAVLRGEVGVDELRLSADDHGLLQLQQLAVRDVALGDGRLAIGNARIVAPELTLGRSADGALRLPLLELLPGDPAAPDVALAPDPRPAAAPPALTPLVLAVQDLVLHSARLRWHDETRPDADPLELVADATLSGLRSDGSGNPARLLLQLAGEGWLDRLGLDGTLQLGPAKIATALQVSARGMRAGPLADHLDGATTVLLEDGALELQLEAELGSAASGTRSLAVSIRELSLRDGDEELLALGALTVAAEDLDDSRTLHLAEVGLHGLRTTLRQQETGLELPGIRLGPAPPAADLPPGPTAAGRRGATMALPRLRVDRLDLDVERVAFFAAGAAEPLLVSARIRAEEPWVTDEDAADTPPFPLSLRAAVLPLCRDLQADLTLQPYAIEPHLTAALRAGGIDTTALARVLPAPEAAAITGTLQDGSLRADLDLDLSLRRRHSLELAPGLPFGCTLRIDDLALLDDAGVALASLGHGEIEVDRLDPGGGDIRVQRIELDRPQSRLVASDRGIETLGLRVALREPTASMAPANAVDSQPAAAAPEISVEELSIAGLAFDFRDERTEPPTLLPIADLSLDATQLSSRALTAPRPLQFTLSVQGAPVSLPERATGSLIGGLLSSTAGGMMGQRTRHVERPWLEELYAQGALQLYPMVLGSLQCNITALELPAFQGLARNGGVVIGDGLLDAGSQFSFQRGGSEVTARFVFTHLSVSEPPGGPISSVLRLPAPLDTVLFVLRNDAGEHRIPLHFEMGNTRGSTAQQIRENAIQTLGTLIASALTRSPFRLAGEITGLLGELGRLFGFGGGAEDLSLLQREVVFAAGEATLPDDLAALAPLLSRWRSDPQLVLILEHEFGHEDLEVARHRANPPPELVVQIAAGLRQTVAHLHRERSELAAAVRGMFAAGQLHEAEARARDLRALDDRLGTAELALERTLSLLRPGSERRADRRSRSSAAEIARLRLQALREHLAARGGPGAVDRIDLRPPRNRMPEQASGRVLVRPRQRLSDR